MESSLRWDRECIYWPGMNVDVRDFIQKCDTCRATTDKQTKETLKSHDISQRPWEKLAVDIFHLQYKWYLIMLVDDYSGFIELDKLEDICGHLQQWLPVGVCGNVQFCIRLGVSLQDLIARVTTEQRSGWKFRQDRQALTEMCQSIPIGCLPRAVWLQKHSSQDTSSSPAQCLMDRRTQTLLPTTNVL